MALTRTQIVAMGVGDPGVAHQLCCRSRVVGDPGLLNVFRKIGGGLKKVVGIGAKVAPLALGPIAGPALGMATSILRRPTTTAMVKRPMLPPSSISSAKKVGLGLAGGLLTSLGQFGPGFSPTTIGPGPVMIPGGARAPFFRRRRRMNVANQRALRRATSRVAGFHRLAVSAERALSHLVRKRGRARKRRK